MATALRFLGNTLVFLAGLALGIVLTLGEVYSTHGETHSAIFLFPNATYVLGAVLMVGLSVLLRRAADRIV